MSNSKLPAMLALIGLLIIWMLFISIILLGEPR